MDQIKIFAYRTALLPNANQIRSPLKRIEITAALDALSIERPDVVLDLCCGSGVPGQLMAKRFHRVIGLDEDQSQIADAGWHRSHSKVGLRIELIRGDAQAIPLGDATVDACISLCAIEHIWDGEQACREVFRVLRPGGTFVVTADSLTNVPSDFPVALHSSLYRVVTYYTATSLAQMLEGAGFIVNRCTPILRSQRAVAELEQSMTSSGPRGMISTAVVRRRIDAAERAEPVEATGLFVLGVAKKPAAGAVS